MMEIRDSEKRRARNLIWNAAGEYGFEPDFKAYDQDGQADLYWNCIIGAVRKNYGAAAVEELFTAIHGSVMEEMYEQFLWVGLENAVFQREQEHRPALPALRRSYARRILAMDQSAATRPRLIESAHFRRCLGEEPDLSPVDEKLLDALEFPADWDGETLVKNALELLHAWFGFVPGEPETGASSKPRRSFFLFGKRRENTGLPSVRSFGFGYGEHTVAGQGGGKDVGPIQRHLTDLSAAQTEAALHSYVRKYFGPPLLDEKDLAEREEALCVGDHKGCHLYYAKGDDTLDPSVHGYAAAQRRAALKQMALNKAAYDAEGTRNRTGIVRLTARIRNAMMAYLQPTVVRAASGTLDAGRIWRGVYLNDNKVFTRIQNADPGALSVDLLLDASFSQADRQATVAAQGYMIAESLTRCRIPVRVSSFCSLSGYTVITRYRDYLETDQNQRIFHYFTAGCNRDGLAIRALGRDLDDFPCEHRLVILLSDAKPNDVVQINRDGVYRDYTMNLGIENTAMEVRSLLHRDVSVICVFTGDDADLPAAHTIYGRNFARIRSLDQFADTVGTLIQNQIRSF